jgi:hypothetical protein
MILEWEWARTDQAEGLFLPKRLAVLVGPSSGETTQTCGGRHLLGSFWVCGHNSDVTSKNVSRRVGWRAAIFVSFVQDMFAMSWSRCLSHRRFLLQMTRPFVMDG